jgi:TPR repeat protein
MRVLIILGFMLLSFCSYAAGKMPASKSGLPVCLDKLGISKSKCSRINDINMDLLFLSVIGGGECSANEYKEVFDYYLKLAENGDSHAQYNVGRMYAQPFVVEEDYKKAFDWFLKSAEQGYDEAQFYIAQLYDYNGEIGTGPYSFEKLGREFYYDNIIKKNNEAALKWYLKAAEQGNMKAQRILADAYKYGRYSLPIEKNEKKAFDWYLKLAKQGDADAQDKIGDYYSLGKIVEKNYKEAFNYYLKSAKQGNESAQINLADMYKYGWGTKQNCEEAFKYYEKAGNSYSLGEYYDDGKCEKRNYEKAFKYYLAVFVLGYCDNHGVCFSNVKGAKSAIARLIKEDIHKAYKIIKEEKKEYENSRYNYRYREIREQIEERLNLPGK